MMNSFIIVIIIDLLGILKMNLGGGAKMAEE